MRCTTVRLHAVLALLSALLMALPLAAHQDFRVIGTIVRLTSRQLEVKQTKDGDTIAMEFDADVVRVTRGKDSLAPSELAVGMSVVVDATGDHIYDLAVRDIMIVPPPAARKKKD